MICPTLITESNFVNEIVREKYGQYLGFQKKDNKGEWG